jgi:hypothetical protein
MLKVVVLLRGFSMDWLILENCWKELSIFLPLLLDLKGLLSFSLDPGCLFRVVCEPTTEFWD